MKKNYSKLEPWCPMRSDGYLIKGLLGSKGKRQGKGRQGRMRPPLLLLFGNMGEPIAPVSSPTSNPTSKPGEVISYFVFSIPLF